MRKFCSLVVLVAAGHDAVLVRPVRPGRQHKVAFGNAHGAQPKTIDRLAGGDLAFPRVRRLEHLGHGRPGLIGPCTQVRRKVIVPDATIIRTYAPLTAGIARCEYKSFTLWNIVGAVAWATSVTLLGTWLGHFEIVAKNIDAIAVIMVLVPVLPWGVE